MCEIFEPGEKSRICGEVLAALPEWFGHEASAADYVAKVAALPFYAVFDGETTVGFVAIKPHNAHTAEICVMGVLPAYHGKGIGKRLIARCEQHCRENNFEFLTVKTLDESAKYAPYEKTRKFYFSAGFVPLEVFPLFWDKDNPCLFMAKYVG